ncbi:uncharacterized protein LOC111795354 [Cucurbita pepo subsp. pepo]|uniref:uncharacterized protein LOC111795354 n=1 Tax=Cucurbita pepo subsp. pepo TaxID=3664 RepID=UPI000C9D5150|nr:uncharacterized protein LOC111795354 [Cucurbita pepo subsp. pepo]XP_023533484.1 uncharacterized protein LOC111795354 [Cucurbita pepo subsp. pepo]XP_023533485.1 uncharacterized protein LOC111795354 [Cucurbita pepo subsp. pepo]XP_023533486.1 uncharacterized protein LOC111795354 [Cucurbita pepo subsp. pepo]XP_023533487.1 uncharacterized protein LOC111795354 [Cucurbita pepo subsp. pepo]
MGSVCCVAARDKTIVSGSGSETLCRNIRYSPNWSFRWDNRGRVAGEETSISWFSDSVSRNDRVEPKCESAYASEDGSPLEHLRRRRTWQKSPPPEGTTNSLRTPSSGQSNSRNLSIDVSLEQVKEATESPAASYKSPANLSLSLPSASSLSTSPLSSQSYLPPTNSSLTRCSHRSPGHQLLRQVSDGRIRGLKSPSSYLAFDDRPRLPSWSNESVRESHGGSSDCWSVHAFSELMATSHRERWSFDSDSFGFNGEKIGRSSSQFSTSSVDLQTCGVCLKLLTEKSSWSSQRIIANNELSVAAILTCGHVYHADCLESMTPEIHKYDPACPVCTFGEKHTQKLSEKALKAEMDWKSLYKRSKNCIADSGFDGDYTANDPFKNNPRLERGSKMSASSSMRSSSGKPFLKRHFSFGSKGSSRMMSDNHSTRRKGFFWTKSSKI